MLLESDAAIVRRDPALPGLATLLDPVAFGDALRRALPGLVLGPAKLVYVKPARNYLVGYRLTVNGEPLNIYAKTYPQASAAGKLAKARERPGITGPLGPGRLALDEIATVVSVYPNDDRVKALSLLVDDTSRAQVLRELLPQYPKLWQGTLHHLKHKPERRAVLRLDSGDEPQALLKLYTVRGYETARRASQRFTSRGALRLAPDFGHSNRHQILAFGWLPGQLLSNAILDPSFAACGLEPVGAALAELHAQDPADCLARPAPKSLPPCWPRSTNSGRWSRRLRRVLTPWRRGWQFEWPIPPPCATARSTATSMLRRCCSTAIRRRSSISIRQSKAIPPPTWDCSSPIWNATSFAESSQRSGWVR